MANCYALQPARADTEKTAQSGTLMMRRSDVLGIVRKMLHYAYHNAKAAEAEERVADGEMQQSRIRTLIALREALKATPIFENPAVATSIPYSVFAATADDYRAALAGEAATAAETTQIGSVHEHATAQPERPNPTPILPKKERTK